MRKLRIITFLTILLSFTFLHAQNFSGPKFYSGIVMGYNGGFGLQLNLAISNFQNSLPISARVALAYTSLNPGKADAVRRIFINNATNGTPEESGKIWEFRFDILFPFRALPNSYIYVGPRYSMFTGNFKYIGGNEDFDVTSNQFGLGSGIETRFPIISNLSMVLSGGMEYYFESRLKGHDTSYSPDGDDVNPRENYSYSDADDAVNQPKLLARFMFGINYAF